MSEPYEEILAGEVWLRSPPGARHEAICTRLHSLIEAWLAKSVTPRLRLAPSRSILELKPGTMVRPDLALIEFDAGRPWLVVEIISPDDHQPDTVAKKAIYEDVAVPRLWMVDPRYDNVEVYEAGEYGLALRAILASREAITDSGLPEFELAVADLFAQ